MPLIPFQNNFSKSDDFCLWCNPRDFHNLHTDDTYGTLFSKFKANVEYQCRNYRKNRSVLANCIIKTSCLAMIHVTITTEEVACWYCSLVVSQRFVKKIQNDTRPAFVWHLLLFTTANRIQWTIVVVIYNEILMRKVVSPVFYFKRNKLKQKYPHFESHVQCMAYFLHGLISLCVFKYSDMIGTYTTISFSTLPKWYMNHITWFCSTTCYQVHFFMDYKEWCNIFKKIHK